MRGRRFVAEIACSHTFPPFNMRLFLPRLVLVAAVFCAVLGEADGEFPAAAGAANVIRPATNMTEVRFDVFTSLLTMLCAWR